MSQGGWILRQEIGYRFAEVLFLLLGCGRGVKGSADNAAPDQTVVFRVIHVHRQLACVDDGSLALAFAVESAPPTLSVQPVPYPQSVL